MQLCLEQCQWVVLLIYLWHWVARVNQNRQLVMEAELKGSLVEVMHSVSEVQ